MSCGEAGPPGNFRSTEQLVLCISPTQAVFDKQLYSLCNAVEAYLASGLSVAGRKAVRRQSPFSYPNTCVGRRVLRPRVARRTSGCASRCSNSAC